MLESHSLNVKKCISNVLITGEFNFDEKCPTAQSSIRKEVTSYKIHILVVIDFVTFFLAIGNCHEGLDSNK